MKFIGIDPGLDGAVAALDEHGRILSLHPMPVIAGKKRQYLAAEIVRLLEGLQNQEGMFITIEKALIFPGQGVTSTCAGVGGQLYLTGLAAGMKIPHSVVPPRTWQRLMFLGSAKHEPKATATIIASRLWPTQTWLRTEKCSKPNQAYIDAALIAEYGRRTHIGLQQEERRETPAGELHRRAQTDAAPLFSAGVLS